MEPPPNSGTDWEAIHRPQGHRENWERKGRNQTRSGSETRRQRIIGNFSLLNVRFYRNTRKRKAIKQPTPTDTKKHNKHNKGQLTGHIKERTQRRIDLIVNQILYIDDGAFFFESREDAKLGLEMIDRVFQKFGLEMHIGRGEQLSKTEVMYVPKPFFYQTPTNITIGAPPTQTPPPPSHHQQMIQQMMMMPP
jgi:hypothetical protein